MVLSIVVRTLKVVFSVSKGGTVIAQALSISNILHTTEYGLDLFSPEEINAIQGQLFTNKQGKPYLNDVLNGKERPSTPEEIVRQLFLYRLIHSYRYPPHRIALEKGVY